jgi:hypothetical protein
VTALQPSRSSEALGAHFSKRRAISRPASRSQTSSVQSKTSDHKHIGAGTCCCHVCRDPAHSGTVEPFTLAIAQLAYESDEEPEIAYRIVRFGK